MIIIFYILFYTLYSIPIGWPMELDIIISQLEIQLEIFMKSMMLSWTMAFLRPGEGQWNSDSEIPGLLCSYPPENYMLFWVYEATTSPGGWSPTLLSTQINKQSPRMWHNIRNKLRVLVFWRQNNKVQQTKEWRLLWVSNGSKIGRFQHRQMERLADSQEIGKPSSYMTENCCSSWKE